MMSRVEEWSTVSYKDMTEQYLPMDKLVLGKHLPWKVIHITRKPVIGKTQTKLFSHRS